MIKTDEKFLLIVHIDVILKESLVHLLQEFRRKVLPICICKFLEGFSVWLAVVTVYV